MKKIALLLTALALMLAFGSPVLLPRDISAPVFYANEQYRVRQFVYNSSGALVSNATVLMTYTANETINIGGKNYDCYHIEINGTYEANSTTYDATGRMFYTRGDSPSLVTMERAIEATYNGTTVKQVENQTNNPPSLGIQFPFTVGSTWSASWNSTTTSTTYINGYPMGSASQSDSHSYNASVVKKLDYTLSLENMSSGERKNMTFEVYNITYYFDNGEVEIALYSPKLKINLHTVVYNSTTWVKMYEEWLDGFKVLVVGESGGGNGGGETPGTPGTTGGLGDTTWIIVGAGIGAVIVIAAIVLLLKNK